VSFAASSGWARVSGDRLKPPTRGYSFGVHKALDKSGAVLGRLLAYGLLW